MSEARKERTFGGALGLSPGTAVQINSLALEGKRITVDMVTQGRDDPRCCPTQQVVPTYTLQGQEMYPVDLPAPQGPIVGAASLHAVLRGWTGGHTA